MNRANAICFVSEPSDGGVKRYIINAIVDLCSMGGYRITYLYSMRRHDQKFPSELEFLVSIGVECIHVDISPEVDLALDLRSAWFLLSFFKCREFDVIHAHSSKAGFLVRLVGVLLNLKTPILYSPHGIAIDRSWLYKILEDLASFWATAFVAVSMSERRRLRAIFPWKTILLTPLYPILKLDRARYFRLPRRPYFNVVTCGRVSKVKNPRIFFELALFFKKKYNDIKFTWIGDYGKDSVALACKCINDLEEHVKVTGWVGEPMSYVRDADIFCMFSEGESFCYAAADAIALGVPVLLTDVMGLCDLSCGDPRVIWDQSDALPIQIVDDLYKLWLKSDALLWNDLNLDVFLSKSRSVQAHDAIYCSLISSRKSSVL